MLYMAISFCLVSILISCLAVGVNCENWREILTLLNRGIVQDTPQSSIIVETMDLAEINGLPPKNKACRCDAKHFQEREARSGFPSTYARALDVTWAASSKPMQHHFRKIHTTSWGLQEPQGRVTYLGLLPCVICEQHGKVCSPGDEVSDHLICRFVGGWGDDMHQENVSRRRNISGNGRREAYCS